MAHQIDMTTGKAAVFVTGEPAWHRLGVVVSAAQTSADAIKLAGLDWTVNQVPIFAEIGGQKVVIPGKLANIRSDTGAVLEVLSGSYKVYQNRQCFDFMDAIVGEKLAMFETAGSLKGGRIVWMMARIPRPLFAAPTDAIHPYILLTNGHDGKQPLRIIPTSVRVVCQNTLNLALGCTGENIGFTIYHCENLEARVRQAKEKLGLVNQAIDNFSTNLTALTKRSLSRDELAKYFAKLLDNRAEKNQLKTMDQFLANWQHSTNTLEGIQGTAWAAYNAVSHYADHQSPVRGTEQQRLDNRLHGIWFGPAAKSKAKAFDLAVQMAV